MAIPQKLLLETLKAECGRVHARYAQYNKHVLQAVAEIVTIEKSHLNHHTNVVQKVSDQCDVLGELLERHGHHD